MMTQKMDLVVAVTLQEQHNHGIIRLCIYAQFLKCFAVASVRFSSSLPLWVSYKHVYLFNSHLRFGTQNKNIAQ